MSHARILFLGPVESPLKQWLEEFGEDVIATDQKIDAAFINNNKVSFLVSYGYRHIIKKDVLDLLNEKAINLHISFLPWNRGADPNLWSFVENTPKGVSIHYLDEGIDTGDIIAQQKVDFDMCSDTLSSSYDKLQASIQDLFKRNWHLIKSGKCQRIKQAEKGSFHLVKDRKSVEHLLVNGWNTPVKLLACEPC